MYDWEIKLKKDEEHYKALQELNYSVIDKVDLRPYFDRADNIGDLADMIEADYENADWLPQELEGLILNYINDDELCIYLKERYGVEYKPPVIEMYETSWFSDGGNIVYFTESDEMVVVPATPPSSHT